MGSIKNTFGVKDGSIQKWKFGPGGEGVIHAIDPGDANTIYTGSDCGLVYVTTDAGKNWQNITPVDLQESQINSIEASRFEQGVVYISATRYKFNDYASYTYKTTDNGKTWTKINNGIKNDDFVKVIREDNKNKNILYAGSERGFYISNDAGTTWKPFQLNLPIVPVTDLMIRDNDLVAATAGRAFWILDDISTIQQNANFNSISVPTMWHFSRTLFALVTRWRRSVSRTLISSKKLLLTACYP
jgi:hypothetical protein